MYTNFKFSNRGALHEIIVIAQSCLNTISLASSFPELGHNLSYILFAPSEVMPFVLKASLEKAKATGSNRMRRSMDKRGKQMRFDT